MGRAVVVVQAFDVEPILELFDEDAFATAGIENTEGRRQAGKIAPDIRQLLHVRRVIVPVATRVAMVVAARWVLTGGDVRLLVQCVAHAIVAPAVARAPVTAEAAGRAVAAGAPRARAS